MIREFLRKLDIAPSGCEHNAELEAELEVITQVWPYKSQIKAHIVTGLVMAETAYCHVSDVQARVAIAVYTAIITALDDPERFDSAGAQEFWRGVCDGSLIQESSILGDYARVLLSMGDFYSNYSSGAILASSLRFLNGEMIGNPKSNAFITPPSEEFVDYSRDMTGVAEAYAAFIWIKSDFPDENSYIQVFR